VGEQQLGRETLRDIAELLAEHHDDVVHGLAAADKMLRRMNIGVCFQTGGKAGFSRFWVVVAFFPAN
jgi:hypothetical protein